MVAGDQPLLPIPFVREGVPSLHTGTRLLECEGIEAGVDGGIAIDLDVT